MSQGGNVRIVRANNDAALRLGQPVQALEISAVECQNRPPLARGESQQLGIRYALVGAARFVRREDVMAKPAKLLDNAAGHIFVTVQARHERQSASLSRMAASISSM